MLAATWAVFSVSSPAPPTPVVAGGTPGGGSTWWIGRRVRRGEDADEEVIEFLILED